MLKNALIPSRDKRGDLTRGKQTDFSRSSIAFPDDLLTLERCCFFYGQRKETAICNNDQPERERAIPFATEYSGHEMTRDGLLNSLDFHIQAVNPQKKRLVPRSAMIPLDAEFGIIPLEVLNGRDIFIVSAPIED